MQAMSGVPSTLIAFVLILRTVSCESWALPEPHLSHEDFAEDPGWEGHNNLPSPDDCVTTEQDFGYTVTNHAGGETGEIGGKIGRSLQPSSYAVPIAVKTLEDKLEASGKFAVTDSRAGSGMLFGWFNSSSRGWRTPNSLAFRIDGEGDKFRVFFEYGTQTWKTGGGRTFEGRYQVTKTPMHPADGTVHTWSLVYDPSGAGAAGEMTFTLDGKTYAAPLADGHKQEGAVFNRFGAFNQQISGKGLTVYFDDLRLDGTEWDFSEDPGWEEIDNRIAFEDCGVRPVHDFGYRDSNHAGGKPGEIGGRIWRIESTRPENACHYGTPVSSLSLDDELEASGKMSLTAASADSAILLGWFNSHTPVGAPPLNFLGVLIEGPSRAGHYFRPAYGTSDNLKSVLREGPIVRPDSRSHEWSFHYRPEMNGEGGRITVKFDGESVNLDLPETARKGNAAFDHFGFLSWNRGGHFVEVFFDDLTYTAGKD